MNIKAISRHVGLALLVSSLFMFMSLMVSIIDGLDSAFAPLLISFMITFIVGAFPFIFVRKSSQISLKEGFVTIVLSWLLSFIFGMLPYALWGGPFNLINAWFESVSGFTTTGATILGEIESLPRSLLFWRSATHFIGGLGVVVFLLLVIPSSSQMRLRLSSLELSSLSKDGYNTRTNRTIYIFTLVYLVLNVVAFIAYWAAGMNVFDALCHAMSVCATGGFSTKNFSIASFNSMPITIITMVFMYLASIHFGMIFMVFAKRSLKPLNNPVLKVYTYTILVGTTLVAATLKSEGVETTWGGAFLNSGFHILSYASTTGFAIADNALWPYFPSIFLMVFGIMCGMAGSTTGGVKTDRVIILHKALRLHVNKSLHPTTVAEMRIGRKAMEVEDFYPQILYVAVFFLIMILSLLGCLAVGVHNDNALMATLSSLSNVGPAVGELGTFGNYDAQPVAAKLWYTFDMFMGRVEIYPVLAVIALFLPNKKH